jgi:hypothetical protein
MKPSDNLFKLIKSLDKSEKGYFKKFAASHAKNSNYILLFDLIDAQETYDEGLVLKKLKGQTFAKQIAVTKNYLWELILRSQRQYRRESSKFMQLNALLENGEILFEKGLYEEALKQWDRAKTLAEAYNEMPFLMDIETNKRRYYIDMTASNWKTLCDPSYQYSFDLLDEYSKMLLIQKKYVEIVNVIKVQPYFRTPEQKQEWDLFIQDPLLAPENEPKLFWGKLYFNYIYNIYHLLCRNKSEALLYIKNILELWDTHVDLKNMEPVKYLSAVHNYLTNLMFLNEKEAFIAYFEQFKPPALSSFTQEAIYFEHIWLMRNSYYALKKDYNGLLEFIETSSAELEKYAAFINKVRLLIIRFNIAYGKMIKGDFEGSNDVLHLIFDSKEVELRKDIQANARILYTINHYEQNNLLLFKHVINTSKHFLRNNDFYYDAERIFMKFMTRLSKEVDKSERLHVFESMKTELLEIFASNESEKNALEVIQLIQWIDSKINNCSYLEQLLKVGE